MQFIVGEYTERVKLAVQFLTMALEIFQRVLDDTLRKCVGYIALPEEKGFRPIGTFSFFGDQSTGKTRCFAITARHVIDGAASLGHKWVILRLNKIGGGLQLYQTPVDGWTGHNDPAVDVVAFPMGIGLGNDHLAFPLNFVISPVHQSDLQIGIAHPVFMVGLFRHHHGTERNIPIVRLGTIAAMNEEPVQTKVYKRDALLIECRSIGGLSGSPVFVNIPSTYLVPEGAQPPKYAPGSYLLGVVHGHFDDVGRGPIPDTEDVAFGSGVNTGIAIVTPGVKVCELIEQIDSNKDEELGFR